MKKDTAKKLLNVLGIITYIGAVLMLILGLAMFFINSPELEQELAKAIDYTDTNVKATIVVGILFVIIAVFEIIEGWALRRAGKAEKTTLALVLTAIGFVGSILGLIRTQQLLSQLITIAINALAFYSVIVIRQDEKK